MVGYAITQPALDALGRNPGVFLASNLGFGQVAAFALAVTLIPSMGIWALDLVAAWMLPTRRDHLRAIMLGALGGVACLAITTPATDLGPLVSSGLAVAVAVAMAIGVLRYAVVRRFLRYSIVGPALMTIVFLFGSTAAPAFSPSDPGPSARIANPKRVVMIVFDELPTMSLLDGSGTIDDELFPAFARLASTSTWFRNTTTVAPYTEVAVPAILSGRYPRNARAVPALAEYRDNLFTLLRDDYELNVHEVATRLCPDGCGRPDSSHRELATATAKLWRQRVDPRRPESTFGSTEATDRVVDNTRKFLSSIEPTEEPRLDFAHVMLPHEPFRFVGNFQDTLAPAKMPGAAYLRWTEGPGAEVARRRHLLQLQTADQVLGDLLERLERLDELDDALVVVTADHGIAFTPGEPIRSVSEANFAEIMWTPLFVKEPAQRDAVVDDRIASSVDVLPTMLDIVDAATSVEFDGTSLVGPERSSERDVRRLYQDGLTAFEPADVLKPPAGSDHLEFDGRTGFARVMATKGLPPVGDPRLRVFRVGDYGFLIGQPALELIDDRPSDHAASIRNRAERFERVDPNAKQLPWVYNEVFFNGSTEPATLALLDQGVVIGVATSTPLDDEGHGFAMFLVPPSLMVPGEHQLTVAIVRGPPEAPTLDPVLTG